MKYLIALALASWIPTAAAQHEHHQAQPHDHSTMDHSSMDHSTMDHGQDEKPSDARDPHAYSNGYTHHSHPYFDPDMPAHAHGGGESYGALIVDHLEIAASEGEKTVPQLEAEAWYGTSFEKLLLRTELEIEDEEVAESENEILWSHAIGPYFDSVVGVRYDAGRFEGRGYGAIGVRGLAPYWFETNANLYFGEQGQVAFKAEAEYELLFTQRLILSPSLEVELKDLLNKEDTGDLHDRKAQVGLRLRYEIYRRFAPYIGVELSQFFGEDLAEASHDADKQRLDGIAGLKFWL